MAARSDTSSSPDAAPVSCAECEQATTNAAMTLAGARLCADCVAAYYIACTDCGGLVAKDESLARDNLAYCSNCFSKTSEDAGAGVVDEGLIEALIAEYVSLHAEEKRISERLEVIKEQLKKAATGRHRVGNAVTLRAGDEAVRCSYRSSLKFDNEAAGTLSKLLGDEEFSTLFERKTSFNPIKDRIAEFLANPDDTQREAREAVRAALRETETVTLSVMPNRTK
ncbi:MAG: hypothetical protein H7Y30_10745 [Pyrinomonadaceae bacterium]|nr:hypothetical protein [Pyrinomonadaceae bacterium]